MGNSYKNEWSSDETINRLYQKGVMNDGQNPFLQTIINDYLNIASNNKFWQEHFVLDGNEYSTNLGSKKIDPAYTVVSTTHRPIPMAEASAPLSESAQLDNETLDTRTGTIPEFRRGLYETSFSRQELKAKLQELNIQDQNLLQGFVRGVGDLVLSHNYRLSNMSAQVLSKGGAYDNINSMGFSAVKINAPASIPATNFVTAGTKIWTDPTCDIPTQIQAIVQNFKQDNNLPDDMLFELDVPYNLVINVLLKNSYFIKEVNLYLSTTENASKILVLKSDGTTDYDMGIITMEQLVAYSRWGQSKIPPIRVAKESQTVQDITTISTVNGWEAGKVVLRPLGNAGIVAHALVADVPMLQQEANSTVQFSIAKVQNFLYVVNKIVPNGAYQAYHTDVIGRYVPVLTEFNEHCVIDTTTADS